MVRASCDLRPASCRLSTTLARDAASKLRPLHALPLRVCMPATSPLAPSPPFLPPSLASHHPYPNRKAEASSAHLRHRLDLGSTPALWPPPSYKPPHPSIGRLLRSQFYFLNQVGFLQGSPNQYHQRTALIQHSVSFKELGFLRSKLSPFSTGHQGRQKLESAMARAHTAPLLLPALVLLLLGAGAVSGNADFCRTISTALNTCPLVPTADVDLASYTVRTTLFTLMISVQADARDY